MRTPFVSVIVPVLNSEKTIERCITSLLDQDYPMDKYEIIFVDNGSTDHTLKILNNFNKNIKILKEPIESSYRARNKGIMNTKGDIIAFTDSDCVADYNEMEINNRDDIDAIIKYEKVI